MSNKTLLKILIGLGITTAATAIITVGVIKELRALKALTMESDDDFEKNLLDAAAFDNMDEDILAIEATEAED